MTTVDKLADEVVTAIAKSGVWLTIPQRKVVWAIVTQRIRPFVPSLPLALDQADVQKNADQAAAILKLLKQRRSQGATNVELAQIALKYTSRVSELRQAPHHLKITCERQGRLSIYRLVPEDW